ncbi:RNA polymerase factor sigma-54 [bacterium]|jgi:RNA polymerase sigma-54 factor|nr:RNA polymerase factor sigma-54 [bacterium]MBT3794883.1 RNA polymerase factor sigma-54 [bacterium]MBT4634802.1 RNA polymerase factor sigma-54 [bacterium]
MVKINLKQKITQKNKGYLSLESKLFIKLIKLNINEINELLEKEINENPCLEEIGENEIVYEKKIIQADHNVDNEKTIKYDDDNIANYLIRQIKQLNIKKNDKKILACLIYLLNDKGFLLYPNDEIKEILFEQERIIVSEVDIEELIIKSQSLLDPPGILARNIKESLKIQLRLSNNKHSSLCSEILDNHTDNLKAKNLKKIATSLNTSVPRIKRCIKEISQLNINPANIFYSTNSTIRNSKPEAYVYYQNNNLVVQSNKHVKKLKVSSYYKRMLKPGGGIDNEVKDYLKEKIKNGSLLIKTIDERESMYQDVFNLLVEIQKDFILKGERYLKPLKLSDIASQLDIHESTVSRITSNKYISTPRGMINMKSLFDNRANPESKESSTAVQDIIKETIDNEVKSSPLTDEGIKISLKKKGITIARRTIAKYRNILKIPSSNKRANK